MHEVDITPVPMQVVDLDLPLIGAMIGAAAARATSVGLARPPVITAIRHATVTAVRATAVSDANAATPTGVIGSGALVQAPKALSTGVVRIPVVAFGSTVNAVVAASAADAVPVPNVLGAGSVVVSAPHVTAPLSAKIPVVAGATDATVTAPRATSTALARSPATSEIIANAARSGSTSAASVPVITSETVLTGGGPGSASAVAIPPAVSVAAFAPASSFSDNFAFGYNNGVTWTNTLSTTPGSVWDASGTIHIDHTAAPEFNRLVTFNSYSMVGSRVYVEVLDFGNQALPAHVVSLNVRFNAANQVYVAGRNNTLEAYRIVAGTQTLIGSVALNTTNHRWISIMESGGTTFFQGSPNGSTWTTFASIANPITMAPVQISIESGSATAVASPSGGIFDNYNTLT